MSRINQAELFQTLISSQEVVSKPKLPLLEGIRTIKYVTSSGHKLRGLQNLTSQVFWGDGSLIPTSVSFQGDEESFLRPDLVAVDKLDRALGENDFRDHPEYLVCAGDVVCWMEQEGELIPMHNLSRLDSENLTETRLKEEGRKTAKILANGNTMVVWDSSFVVSRRVENTGKLIQLSVADRFMVEFEAICPNKVQNIFWEDLARAKVINARIPLIDDSRLNQHIVRIGFMPLSEVTEGAGFQDWHTQPVFYEDLMRKTRQYGVVTPNGRAMLSSAIRHVVENLPPRVERLLGSSPNRPTSGWKDVNGPIQILGLDLIH